MPVALSSYSYPLLAVFWTILEIFLFVVWIWLLIWIFSDIFRSRDLSGWAKALWVVFVLFLPLIGIVTYLIVRGGSMHDRAVQQAQAQEGEFRAYVQDAAGLADPGGSADQAGRPARPGRHHRRRVRAGESQDPGRRRRISAARACR